MSRDPKFTSLVYFRSLDYNLHQMFLIWKPSWFVMNISMYSLVLRSTFSSTESYPDLPMQPWPFVRAILAAEKLWRPNPGILCWATFKTVWELCWITWDVIFFFYSCENLVFSTEILELWLFVLNYFKQKRFDDSDLVESRLVRFYSHSLSWSLYSYLTFSAFLLFWMIWKSLKIVFLTALRRQFD